MGVEVEVAVGPGAVLGEGPLWDAGGGLLWWIDIPGQQLHRFDPASGTDEGRDLPWMPGTIALLPDGGLAVACPDGVVAWDWDGGEGRRIATIEADLPGNRCNDGKPDAAGRLWVGTMAVSGEGKAGSFYRVDPDGAVHHQFDGVGISNGLGWSPDGATMYWIDTWAGGVEAFDFDAGAGTIAGRRRLLDIPSEHGYPDGMCVDDDGNLWVAMYDGGAVRGFSPAGELLEVIELPCRQVTCPAFGGADGRDLYITTGAQRFDEADRRDQPLAGATFVARPGPSGPRPNAFAVGR